MRAGVCVRMCVVCVILWVRVAACLCACTCMYIMGGLCDRSRPVLTDIWQWGRGGVIEGQLLVFVGGIVEDSLWLGTGRTGRRLLTPKVPMETEENSRPGWRTWKRD